MPRSLTKTVAEPVMTGYYGIPGGKPGGAVHVAFRDTAQPICGARLHPAMEFQWCSTGIHWPYVECGNCKRRLRALLDN